MCQLMASKNPNHLINKHCMIFVLLNSTVCSVIFTKRIPLLKIRFYYLLKVVTIRIYEHVTFCSIYGEYIS